VIGLLLVVGCLFVQQRPLVQASSVIVMARVAFANDGFHALCSRIVAHSNGCNRSGLSCAAFVACVKREAISSVHLVCVYIDAVARRVLPGLMDAEPNMVIGCRLTVCWHRLVFWTVLDTTVYRVWACPHMTDFV
jgi:hypothetical protein